MNNTKIFGSKVRIVQFFKRHPDFFTTIIPYFYPLNEYQLSKFQNDLDWVGVSGNQNINFSIELLEKFIDKWEWSQLSRNKGLSWSVELIEKYEDKWNWNCYGLSGNEGVRWSIELINAFKDRWDWRGLSSNKSLPWSRESIDKFIDRWDWIVLSCNNSLPWSGKLIEDYIDKWDWQGLAINEKLPWSESFIEKYQYKWDWKKLSTNQALPWSEELIETYKDKWDWSLLSQNRNLPWSFELIEKYKDKWGVGWFSANDGLPWTEEFIEKNKDKFIWDSRGLSVNKGLPWTGGFIEKHLWDFAWRDNEDIPDNEGILWTPELVEKHFINRYRMWDDVPENERPYRILNLFYLSSNNFSPFWTEKLVESFKDYWDWGSLSYNVFLPWTIELLERYEDKWDYRFFGSNKTLWEKVFKPYVTNQVVEEIFTNLTPFIAVKNESSVPHEKAIMLIRFEKYQNAKEILIENLKNDPENLIIQSLFYLCNHLLKEDFEKYYYALELIENAIKKSPSNPDFYFIKAIILSYHKDKFISAINTIKQALEFEKKHIYYLYIAIFEMKKGNYVAALKIIEAELVENPANNDLHILKAISLTKLGKYYDALEIFDEILEKEPDNTIVLSEKAITLLLFGKTEDSIKCFYEVMQLEPGNEKAKESYYTSKKNLLPFYRLTKKFIKKLGGGIFNIIFLPVILAYYLFLSFSTNGRKFLSDSDISTSRKFGWYLPIFIVILFALPTIFKGVIFYLFLPFKFIYGELSYLYQQNSMVVVLLLVIAGQMAFTFIRAIRKENSN